MTFGRTTYRVPAVCDRCARPYRYETGTPAQTAAGEDNNVVARAINAASFAASNLVYDYAARFDQASDYEPLEALAERVQHAAVKAACEVLKGKR